MHRRRKHWNLFLLLLLSLKTAVKYRDVNGMRREMTKEETRCKGELSPCNLWCRFAEQCILRWAPVPPSGVKKLSHQEMRKKPCNYFVGGAYCAFHLMILYHIGNNCWCSDQGWDLCTLLPWPDLFFLAYSLCRSHFLFCLMAAW